MNRRESCTRIGNVREMLYQYIYHGVWREDSREGISAATQSFSPHNLHWANYNNDKSGMALLKCFTSSLVSHQTMFDLYFSQWTSSHSYHWVREARDPQYVGDCLYWETDTLIHVRLASRGPQHPWRRYTKLHPATPSTDWRPAFRFHWLRESYSAIFPSKYEDFCVFVEICF